MTETRLPANLPENWEPGQIVAPNGAEVGLSEQHGYNYLMKQVNDSHRVINEQNEQMEHKVTLLTESRPLYVSKEGNDATGDGTQEKPFLTIQKAVDIVSAMSFICMATVSIYIQPGVYRESVLIRNVSGTLELRSATENKDDVTIEGADADYTLSVRRSLTVTARNITFKGSSSQTNGVVYLVNGGSLVLADSMIESDGEGIGAYCVSNSHLILHRVEINNCKNAVYAGGASFIYAVSLTGSGNAIGYIAYGGIITRDGTYVTAETDVHMAAGGQVWPSTPKEHDLELVEGFSYYTGRTMKNCYSINNDGLVVVHFSIDRTDGGNFPKGLQTFAVLPKGFRPTGRALATAVVNMDANGLMSPYSMGFYADVNGHLCYHNPFDNVDVIGGTISFYAQ